MTFKFPLLRSRRSMALGASLVAAMAVTPTVACAQTVTAVMQSGLRVLDPIFTATSAYSSKLSGLLENSRPLFWNMRKAT